MGFVLLYNFHMISDTKIRELLNLAIDQAEKALNTGNYPFGAILTDIDGNILSQGYNENFTLKDLTAHAEMQCLRKIELDKLFDKSKEHILFCSGEPCCGCAFFIARTNVHTLYWALTDPQKEGLGDLKQDEVYKSFLKQLIVIEEPYEDLRKKSANLLIKYYQQINKPEKVDMYCE